MKEIKSCAITGHRPCKIPHGLEEEHPHTIMLKRRIAEVILELYQKGVNCFVAGCAQGVDIWTAEAVILLKSCYPDIRLISAVAYPEQPYKWNQKDKKRFYDVLEQSDKIKWVSYQYESGVYYKRDRYMVDNAELLLAVCDPMEKKSSGTHYTMEYAIQCKKDVICIHPHSLDTIPVFCQLGADGVPFYP